jgi:hypothetical protein
MALDVHGSTWGTLYCGCFMTFLPPVRFKKRERDEEEEEEMLL